MATSVAHVLAQMNHWIAAAQTSAVADAVLLERYLHQYEEAAFAALVARHGAMVLRLCRRILGDAHMAEDAFQATFLILAQGSFAETTGFADGLALRRRTPRRAQGADESGRSRRQRAARRGVAGLLP